MKIISHRGNFEKSKWKENTVEALKEALEKPYIDGVELDVRLTADEEVVIHHDATIDNTSDGHGCIYHMSLNDLYQYNFGTKENPTKIATLKNFFKIIHTDKLIMIELKKGYLKDDILLRKVKEIISEYPNIPVVLCSFHESLIHEYHKLDKTRKVGLLTFFEEEKKEKYISFLSIYYQGIYKKVDIPYYIWTVDKKKELNQKAELLNDNLQGIITNKPKLIYDYTRPVSL